MSALQRSFLQVILAVITTGNSIGRARRAVWLSAVRIMRPMVTCVTFVARNHARQRQLTGRRRMSTTLYGRRNSKRLLGLLLNRPMPICQHISIPLIASIARYELFSSTFVSILFMFGIMLGT